MRRVPIIFLALGLLLWLGGCESRAEYRDRKGVPPRAPFDTAEEIAAGRQIDEAKPYPSPGWYGENSNQPELYTDPQTRCVYFISPTGGMTPRLDSWGRPICPRTGDVAP